MWQPEDQAGKGHGWVRREWQAMGPGSASQPQHPHFSEEGSGGGGHPDISCHPLHCCLRR